MIIVAGGDSFVYGSELNDCTDNHPIHQYGHSKNTFFGLLATDHEYQCVAWPGFGNDSIARTVINACEKNSDVFVMVSWTFPGRYEFRFNYDTGQKTSPWHVINPWSLTSDIGEIEKEFFSDDSWVLEEYKKNLNRTQQNGIQAFADAFYRNVGSSEYWEIYSTLKEISYLQNYLKNKNIPFMFTCADNSILYNHTVSLNDATIQSLYQQIINDDKWFWFPPGTNPQDTQTPRGFYQWAVENKYRMGTTHPLEEAHQDAAKLMKDKFNELVKKSI
jgi:hypothetical protein